MSAAEPQVLDASALLAYLQDEPGGLVVEAALLSRPTMCSVNYAEVLGRMGDAGDDPVGLNRQLVDRGLIGGLLTIVGFTVPDAVEAARLRGLTRPLGLSLGDRACLATARRLGFPVLTADRAWASLNVGVAIRVIR